MVACVGSEAKGEIYLKYKIIHCKMSELTLALRRIKSENEAISFIDKTSITLGFCCLPQATGHHVCTLNYFPSYCKMIPGFIFNKDRWLDKKIFGILNNVIL